MASGDLNFYSNCVDVLVSGNHVQRVSTSWCSSAAPHNSASAGFPGNHIKPSATDSRLSSLYPNPMTDIAEKTQWRESSSPLSSFGLLQRCESSETPLRSTRSQRETPLKPQKVYILLLSQGHENLESKIVHVILVVRQRGPATCPWLSSPRTTFVYHRALCASYVALNAR